jgi:hypothetical protein
MGMEWAIAPLFRLGLLEKDLEASKWQHRLR